MWGEFPVNKKGSKFVVVFGETFFHHWPDWRP